MPRADLYWIIVVDRQGEELARFQSPVVPRVDEYLSIDDHSLGKPVEAISEPYGVQSVLYAFTPDSGGFAIEVQVAPATRWPPSAWDD